MNKKFFISWLSIYILNALSGYLVHHVLLGSTYLTIAETLHADVHGRIWAFIMISIVGSFFFTFFFSMLEKYHSVRGGLLFGFLIGLWFTTGEYLSAYASSNVISLTLAMEWLVLGIVQYVIGGYILGTIYKTT